MSLKFGLLSLLNVTTIWLLAVRSVGLARLSGIKFLPAALWVFGIYYAWMGMIIGVSQAFKAMFF